MAVPPVMSGKGLRCQSPMATTVPTATTPVRRSGIAAGSIRSTATPVREITTRVSSPNP